MTTKPKLTTAIATDMVQRIELLLSQVDDIYTDATLNYAGTNNASVLRDAIKERKAERDAGGYAAGLLESFDSDY